jgi:hypothetical protein
MVGQFMFESFDAAVAGRDLFEVMFLEEGDPMVVAGDVLLQLEDAFRHTVDGVDSIGQFDDLRPEDSHPASLL